ncbi:MAG: LysR family transcriptional regulator [Mogibacterium sp.]|nr:LysR family transcriptional regulator [Mogibacterium sp.]
MKLQQLEYFCAVAEEGSISAASRKLHVAQPPVSRQMALLENELETPLFIRGNKGILLTQAGQQLYQESRVLMQGMESMVSNIRNVSRGIMGTLWIGLLYSAAPYALPYLKRYHDLYPDVDLRVNIDTPQNLTDELRRGRLHVIFIRSGATGQYGFSERIIGEDPLELIMTRELDPAPDSPDIPVELLKDRPFCLLRSDDIWGYSNYLSVECLRNGFRPRVVCQCYSTHVAVQMILAGFGMSYLPRSIVDTVPGSGLYSKPIRGLQPVSSSMLVWNENTYMSRCGRLFVNLDKPETGLSEDPPVPLRTETR